MDLTHGSGPLYLRAPGGDPGGGRPPPAPDGRGAGRAGDPIDPGSGGRAGSDGHQRRPGSKNEPEGPGRSAWRPTCGRRPGGTVPPGFADQGDTGGQPAANARAHGLRPEVVRRPEAGTGFVVPPRRRVAERSFGWSARFRRPARGYDRTAGVLAGWHGVATAGRMLSRVMELAQEPLDPGSEQALTRGTEPA